MATLNSGLQQAWTPEDYGKLVDITVEAKSAAFQLGTVVNTSLQTIRFPVLQADPATGWFAENSSITARRPGYRRGRRDPAEGRWSYAGL